MKMLTRTALAAALLLPGLAAHAQAGGVRPDRAYTPGGDAVAIRDYGPIASDAQGREAVEALVAKWGGVMRRIKGWDESAVAQFKEGYRRLPLAALQEAQSARDFDSMMASLEGVALASAQKSMARAFPLNRLEPQHADDPQVAAAAQLAAKTLGEDARDLVFIPITPCTVWDTRFATLAESAGIITSGSTKKFYTHFNGAGGSFAIYGGNPSCPETAQNAIGGRPFAAMLTVFTNDATGNGWVTVYRDGDPDPSQATISVYYAPGPTKTQTVITKSSRGYGTGGFDVAVTSRFASVHVAAAVTGYFIKPQATPLECVSVFAQTAVGTGATFDLQIPACTAGYTLTGAGCRTPGFDDADWAIMGMYGNAGVGTQTFCSGKARTGISTTVEGMVRCCRIPGR